MVCKFVVFLIQISTVAGQIASKYQNSRDVSTISPYPTTGSGYKFLHGKVQTQYHGQTFKLGREPRMSPYKPFPPLWPPIIPYLTPGPGYTIPPGKVLPTLYTGPTQYPYSTPGPGYTYPPGKVPTQYPGQTFPFGKEPTLSPYKKFPPDLLPTLGPYLTPGPGYTYPLGKVPTQYPGQTYQPGKEPTLIPYKPFPPLFWPAIFPYLTPGPGYTIPPGKVPPTLYPGQILPIPTQYPGQFPTLSPYKPFPPGYFPTALWYSTPGPGVTYPQGKVPTQYPGQTYQLGQAPTVPPYKQLPSNFWPTAYCNLPTDAFPFGLLPTLIPNVTPSYDFNNQYPGQTLGPTPGTTNDPTKKPYLMITTAIPGISAHQSFGVNGNKVSSQPDLVSTFRPYATPGIWNLYPKEKVPTPYPVVVTSTPPGKEPSMQTYKSFPPALLPTSPAYWTSAVDYTYPPPEKKPTYYGARFPSDYRSTPEPANAPTKKTNVKSTTKPAIITGQGGNGGVCMFTAVSYKQGQQWYDSCSSICVCEDASTGYYRCQPS